MGTKDFNAPFSYTPSPNVKKAGTTNLPFDEILYGKKSVQSQNQSGAVDSTNVISNTGISNDVSPVKDNKQQVVSTPVAQDIGIDDEDPFADYRKPNNEVSVGIIEQPQQGVKQQVRGKQKDQQVLSTSRAARDVEREKQVSSGKQSSAKTNVSDTGSKEGARIRNVSETAVNIVKSEFPNAIRQGDAVTAFIYAMSGVNPVGESDTIKSLVAGYEKQKPTKELVEHISVLEKRVASLEQQNHANLVLMTELRIMLSYLVYDRLGFQLSSDVPTRPMEVDLLDYGVEELMDRIHNQAVNYRLEHDRSEGRLKK